MQAFWAKNHIQTYFVFYSFFGHFTLNKQIFKLLPSREEGNDWQTPLENLIIEVAGMAELLKNHIDLFSLLCRMEGLSTLIEEDDFLKYSSLILLK